MDKKTFHRWAPLVLVMLLLCALFLLRQCEGNTTENAPEIKERVARGLNRNPDKIIYSKHARCRMGCRMIDEDEVKEMLKGGKINYAKSELGDRPDCKRKYAVEGTTSDKQRVRIIFAPCGKEVTVVTVIDIGKEWPCDCD
jgi:hypothetical protein